MAGVNSRRYFFYTATGNFSVCSSNVFKTSRIVSTSFPRNIILRTEYKPRQALRQASGDNLFGQPGTARYYIPFHLYNEYISLFFPLFKIIFPFLTIQGVTSVLQHEEEKEFSFLPPHVHV
jgi:hypothetical protein